MPDLPRQMAPTQIISPDDTQEVGQRLDRFLGRAFRDRSRSQIQRLIEDHNVLVDGQPTKAGYRIRGKEQIEIRLPKPVAAAAVAEPIPLEIIYEDADLAVVNKPAGMVVHVGAGVNRGTLVNALLHHFGQLSQSGGTERPGIVHRLDKQTSGLLVVAKNDFSHLSLSRQFQMRTVTKRYLALVHGEFGKDHGEIKAPIGRDRVHRIKMSTRASLAREAHTSFQVRERFPKFTLLELRIKTGRTHQIRVHLSSMKHPVVGDTLYGAPGRIVLPGTRLSVPTLQRNFLHAAVLEFSHPRTQELLQFSCELPGTLLRFLENLRRPRM
jgi:23S rRNA pseudouridine1911/1915/1917 synthase